LLTWEDRAVKLRLLLSVKGFEDVVV
jgi:hypothetical protein